MKSCLNNFNYLIKAIPPFSLIPQRKFLPQKNRCTNRYAQKKRKQQQKEVEKNFDTPISPFPVSSDLFQPSRLIINHKSPNRTEPESESNEWVSLSRDLARELVSIHLVYWHKHTLYPRPTLPLSDIQSFDAAHRIILQLWHTHP